MCKDIPQEAISITDVELTPGKPDVCLGNGERGFECCCDECDHFLLCFPEFDVKSMKKARLRIAVLRIILKCNA